MALVSGESDAQTLWHHGVAALAVPARERWSEEREDTRLRAAVECPCG